MNKMITSFLVLLFLAGGLAAQQVRPCLDVTGDGKVDLADVDVAAKAVGPRDAMVDLRADFDLTGSVDVVDLVRLLRVANGEQPGLLGFSSYSVRAGEWIDAQVQGLVGERKGPRVVVVTADGEHVVTSVRPRPNGVAFRMPNVDPGPSGVVAIRMEGKQATTNLCRLTVVVGEKKDTDKDGILDEEDTCPFYFDPMNADTDNDGFGDFCDNCPATPNRDQADSNGDGSGDACVPPKHVVVNGQVITPEQGIDPRFFEAQEEKPHGVLVLTREIDMHIDHDLIDMGVEIVRPVARHAFVVGVEKRALDVLAGQRWFHALFPIDEGLRKIGDLRNLEPKPGDQLELGIEMHPDVKIEEGRELLAGLGARIIAEGIELVGEGRFKRRIGCWNVLLDGSHLDRLLKLDAVFTVQLGYRNTTQNSNSRPAINVDLLNTSGLNGAGITYGEWDGGWVAGDPTLPPALPAGGTNNALDPRVMVRDHLGGFEGFTPPTGCTTSQIKCDLACSYHYHATHVGGTMIGNGALEPSGSGANRGMADQGALKSYEWPDDSAELACERRDAITNFGTLAHNNSWGYCPGCSFLADYVGLSADYDTEIRAFPEAVEVFSAANYQTYRINLFNPCSGMTDPACAMPSVYAAPTCTAPPAGITPPPIVVPALNTARRFYTVSAPGGTAKNTLVVGNANDVLNRLNNSSSMGPTLDGRLKPEVVAHGTSVVSTCVPGDVGPPACAANGYVTLSGTSMAAPAVAGAMGLLQERAGQIGVTLQNADLRALATHTARDLGVHVAGGGLITIGTLASSQWAAFSATPDGPDFMTGYGMLDADAARDHLENGNELGGTLQPSGCPTGVSFASIPFNSPVAVGGPGPVPGCPSMIWDVVWYVNIPPGITEVKITIAWDDPAGTGGGGPALVNDIDLSLVEPGFAGAHYPWWLDASCPFRPATRVQTVGWDPDTYGDHVNNLEQVHAISGLYPGAWKIIVRSAGLSVMPQPFSMMISTN